MNKYDTGLCVGGKKGAEQPHLVIFSAPQLIPERDNQPPRALPACLPHSGGLAPSDHDAGKNPSSITYVVLAMRNTHTNSGT